MRWADIAVIVAGTLAVVCMIASYVATHPARPRPPLTAPVAVP